MKDPSIPFMSKFASTSWLGFLAIALVVITTCFLTYMIGSLPYLGYFPGALLSAAICIFCYLIILGPLSMSIAERNGAPFKEDDIVIILSGKFKGLKGRVISFNGNDKANPKPIRIELEHGIELFNSLEVYCVSTKNKMES